MALAAFSFLLALFFALLSSAAAFLSPAVGSGLCPGSWGVTEEHLSMMSEIMLSVFLKP